MNFRLLYFSILSVVTVLGCKEKDKQSSLLKKPIISIDLATGTAPSQRKWVSSFTELRFLPLETSPDILIAEVSKVIEADDKILIVDRRKRELHVFDSTGKYLYDIGKIGQGPGEFVDITDCFYDSGSRCVFVCSNESGMVLKYTIDGRFVTSSRIKFFPAQFAKRNNEFIFFTNNNFSDLSGTNNVLFLDSSFNLKRKMFPLGYDPDGTIGFSGLISVNNEGEVLFNEALKDTIFAVSDAYEVYAKYRFDFGDYSVPEIMRRDFSRFMRDGLKHSYLRNRIYDTDTALVFSYIHNRRMYFGFLNKRNNAVITGRESANSGLTRKILPPVGTYHDFYVSAIDVNSVKQGMEEDPALREEILKELPDLARLLTDAKDADNPILMFFKLKL